MDEVEREPEEFLNQDETGGRNNRTRLVILVLVVGLVLGYMVYAAFPGNALYFMSVSEFMNKEEAQDGRIVRVSGKLVVGSYQREGKTTLSRFQLIDADIGPAVEHLSATYVGVPPDLFFNPHSEIILTGSYGQGRVFEADTIWVKCPSKFRSLQDELQQS